MLLSGLVPEDQLEFDLEIDKTTRRNQSKKRKEKKKQGQAKGEFSNTLKSHNQTEFQMANNRQGPRHFSSIAIPPDENQNGQGPKHLKFFLLVFAKDEAQAQAQAQAQEDPSPRSPSPNHEGQGQALNKRASFE